MVTMLTEPGEIVRTDRGPQLRLAGAYPVSAAQVWAALTEPERVGRWLGRLTLPSAALLVRPECRSTTGTAGRVDFDDGYADLTVLACDAPHRMELGWAFGGGVPTQVLVTLSGDTTVALEHTFPADREAADVAVYGCGWQYYLDALGAHLAGAPLPAWDDYYPGLVDQWRARVPSAG
jgi:uncharacterized protein YndB with AHSA1/START domain